MSFSASIFRTGGGNGDRDWPEDLGLRGAGGAVLRVPCSADGGPGGGGPGADFLAPGGGGPGADFLGLGGPGGVRPEAGFVSILISLISTLP